MVAFPHDQKPDQEQRTIDIDGETHPYLSLIVWSTVATPPGLPATVMPVGRSKAGLPIGVQIIGPLLEDRTPLAFAAVAGTGIRGFRRGHRSFNFDLTFPEGDPVPYPVNRGAEPIRRITLW